MIRRNSTYVITPDSFQVSPAITGLPLARPSRRLAAMLLDLLIVALLVKTAGAVMLGVAAALFAFRMSVKVTGTGTHPLGRMVRLGLRTAGAFILFVIALNGWSKGTGAVRQAVDRGVRVSIGNGKGGDTMRVSPMQALGVAREATALQNAESEDEARRLAGELAAGFRRGGMPEGQVRETLEGIASGAEQAWMDRAVQGALAARPAAAARRVSPDSLARAYAAAVSAGDSAAAGALRPQLASALARDSLDALRGELRQAEREKEQAAERADRAESRGIVASIGTLLDELGIGFGWTGLYFTAFLALWRGQTPGKRLAGIRVVRLNGQPITLWTAFERFGGYAAGLVTGLLGFAQVYWDRNRQMIHDKIVETVVVRERGASSQPTPGQA